jgi:methyl-accepting chemotaxis protein
VTDVAAVAEESSASAQTLSATAEQLNGLVGRVKVAA